MSEDVKENILKVLRFFTNRLFILSAIAVVVFAILVAALFDRQIVSGYRAEAQIRTSTRTMYVNAPRGQIFDMHGRPLAINIPVFTVNLDSSIPQTDANASFMLFMDIMARHNEDISVQSEFLINNAVPMTFTSSPAAQRRWMLDLGLDEEVVDSNPTAAQAYALLLEQFEIPAYLNAEDAHTLLLMRTALYLQRFNLNQIPLATDIDRRTVAALEEHNQRMPGIYVGFDYLRYYPMGKYVNNIVGFMNRITYEEYQAHRALGYLQTDLFGRTGIEQAFELNLRGRRGYRTVEINNFRQTRVLESVPPVPGDDIFLTIDAVLQRNLYYAIEDVLSTILLNRLAANTVSFTREILDSMLRANNICSITIMNADEYSPASYAIANFVRDYFDEDETPSRTYLNELIGEWILSGQINVINIFEAMAEQGVITMTDADRTALLVTRQMQPAEFLRGRIEAREITPHLVNIHPATGSVVVTCVDTGAIRAAVNYPAFNGNNLLPHRFDAEYVWRINNDPTSPQVNRAFSEAQAPGSSFKMVTALAGLSQGIITPTTMIFDNVVFTDAGYPPMRCHSRHGSINVVTAIAASCNYFFGRVAFDLGNHRNDRTIQGIETLNYYMMAMGMGLPTGVEIQERPMATAHGGVPRISSPAYMQHVEQRLWFDGDTVNTSIGQGLNAYTPATMARYFATLATGGVRRQMHFLDRIVSAGGDVIYFEPVVEYTLDIAPEHLEAIHRGMFEVAHGARGTGRGIFAGFPMEVGLKSGTAETGLGISHTTYGGFAPFNNPQIAVYAIIPFGDSRYLRAAAGHLMRATLEEYFGLLPYTSEEADTILER